MRRTPAPQTAILSILTVSILTALVAVVPAQADADAVGHWEGQIEVPENPIPIAVDFNRNADGSWNGLLDIPPQSLADLALRNVLISDDGVSFELPDVPGDPFFVGAFSRDFSTISGDFSQGERTIPFTLKRTSKVPEPASGLSSSVKAWIGEGVAGEGAAGTWRGALSVASKALRIEVKIRHGDDGSLAGTLSSVDQGAIDLPLDAVALADGTLSFTVPSVGGRFEGKLSDDGSTVAGSWTQGGGSVPLTMVRAGDG